jgi:ornithine cyclodeaminase/alanine dehydrogenase-like protein (mu-crystallin family)
MDGSYVTAIRTACASAMATKVLANPDSKVVGILGAGVQARAHIVALTRVRNISAFKIHSPSGLSAAKLQEEMRGRIDSAIEVVSSAEQAVRDADLVVTVTTAKAPIIKADWLKPGTHINAVGSHRPDLRELDGVTLARAKVVVDSRAAIMAECGDILLAIQERSIAPSAVHAEIGEVLAGTKPGRTDESEITLYKSVGIAIQDVAAAHLIYNKALQQGVGSAVEI